MSGRSLDFGLSKGKEILTHMLRAAQKNELVVKSEHLNLTRNSVMIKTLL